LKNEETLERRLIGLEEAADEEGHADRGGEENYEENVGHGGAEVAEKLALKHWSDLGHGWEAKGVGKGCCR
jgi:hypothetical protein